MCIFNRFSLFFIAAILFSVSSCDKNITDDIRPNNFDNSRTVTASIYGTVVDEAGNPVSGANVKLNSNTTTTNDNGLFFFTNVTTPERASTVVVSQSGYFNGSRTIFVKANGKHSVKIMLMAKGAAKTFSAASGGTVEFNGLSITFPPNGIVMKATNAAYSGQVFVYAHTIDPTTDEGKMSMPGDLRGIGTDGNEKVMISYGMFVAELYDAAGNALQIAGNSKATISLDVPTSLQSTAPSTIPLWHFDETIGVWIEEGSATLQNGKYVGTVKHFSFWNCDIPAAAIDLQMTLVDQDGNPLQGYWVTLTNTANQDNRGGTTDNNGWIGGLVYPNATLTLNVYPSYNSGSCSNISIYTQTVTTGSSNQSLGTINITISPATSATINATVQDCNNAPISNAVVLVQPLGISLSSDASGNITYTLPCTPTTPVTLVAYDLSAGVNGSSSPITLSSGVNNLGVLTACGTLSPFLNFTLTNTVTSAVQMKAFVYPDADFLLIDSTSTSQLSAGVVGASYISIVVNGAAVGTFAVNEVALYWSLSSFPDIDFTFNAAGSTVTYTSFPISGNAEGNFTLNFTGATTGNPYTATGSFRIPRQ